VHPIFSQSRSALLGFSLAFATHLAALPTQAGVVASGTFQSKEAGLVAGGSFEVQENAGKYSLVVKSDFQVSEGPDLYFAFHPLAAAAVNGGNAKTGTLRVNPMLKSLRGAQTFDLGTSFDATQYKSLIIHCWKFNHLYAAGTITVANPTSLQPVRPSGKREGVPMSRKQAVVFKDGAAGIDAKGRRLQKKRP
jgi:hypothetical protein